MVKNSGRKTADGTWGYLELDPPDMHGSLAIVTTQEIDFDWLTNERIWQFYRRQEYDDPNPPQPVDYKKLTGDNLMILKIYKTSSPANLPQHWTYQIVGQGFHELPPTQKLAVKYSVIRYLVESGWEPFAVGPIGEMVSAHTVYFRRQIQESGS